MRRANTDETSNPQTEKELAMFLLKEAWCWQIFLHFNLFERRLLIIRKECRYRP